MSYYNHSNPTMYHVPNGRVVALPTAKVELSVSVSDLCNRDFSSLSDPFCVLFTRPLNQKQWHETGRTEVLRDTLNSEWQHKFIVEYHFETKQDLKFSIYDHDGKKDKLSQHDFLGCIECTLGEVVAAPAGKLTRKLQHAPIKTKATITVRAEEIGSSKDDVTLELQGRGLDKKDMMGKSDPYMKISKMNQDGSCTLVYRSEVMKNTLNPVWKPMDIPLVKLCNGNYDRQLRFDCYDDDNDGTDGDLIGVFTTTLRKLLNTHDKAYELINEKKRAKKKKYKNSGVIHVHKAKVEKRASFMDYLQSGTQMNFTVAIDFTASNGNPHDPSSLHYRSPDGWNQYTTAIRAVGDIIQDYDTDKMFPALGFGAKIPPRGGVSHEFALSFDVHNPYCAGIDGVIQAYYNSIQAVQLWGPTNFAPVIRHVSSFARKCQDGSNYFVLLIITDGVISDMAETKAALVEASSLPMSVIIVGVGDADFSAMNELDGDDKKIKSYVGVAKRDIVQFVPIKRFLYGGDWYSCQMKLAEAVLAEVPTQLLQYMKSKNLKPRRKHNQSSPFPASEIHKMSIHEPVHQAKTSQKEHAAPSMYQSAGVYPSSAPYPGQNSTPYHTSQSSVRYPSTSATVYPGQNASPYPSQGSVSYPSQGSVSYPSQGSVSYPSQGSVSYPSQGSVSYPSHNNTPYPAQNNAPYPTQNGMAYPRQGYISSQGGAQNPSWKGLSAPYPNMSAPYPSQMSNPYPSQGGAYPNQSSAAYPLQSSAPYPLQSSAPYQTQNTPFYQNQSRAPYPI